MAAAAVTIILAAIVRLGATGPIRVVLALAFVTFVPGWALFGRSRIVHGVSRVALAVTASFTACLAAAVTMAWLGSWHPVALFYAFGAITVMALLRPSRRARRDGTAEPAAPLAEPAVPLTNRAETAAPAAPIAEPAAPIAEPVPEPEPAALNEPAAPITSTPAPPEAAQPGRLALRPEDLQLTGVTIFSAFPSRPPFSPHELPEFFARIHERHPFVSFKLDGDTGAVMETTDSCRLVVRRDCLEYREMSTDFDQIKEHAVDVFEELQTRLGVAALTTPSCHLEARWDLETNGGVRSSLHEQVARLHRSEVILGSTAPVGVMLQFTGTGATPACTWRLSVEPHEGGAVLVDLTTDYAHDADDAPALGETLALAHRFLMEKVAPFVASVGRPTTGE
ncbi:MAG: hypothetical protein QOF20_611 [Acidimicrobiaceae bacterium]|nr:hypothetical protein [Acidimicrobiaceae bacterium]